MYLALKVLHVMGVVAFLGNITTGLFWHAHAARTRDPKLLFHSMDGIQRSLLRIPSIEWNRSLGSRVRAACACQKRPVVMLPRNATTPITCRTLRARYIGGLPRRGGEPARSEPAGWRLAAGRMERHTVADERADGADRR